MDKEIEFDEIEVKNSEWMVCLSYIGEGYNGDYVDAEDDPENVDDPLIRFYISKYINGSWENETSSCTYLRATDNRELLEKAAKLLLKEVSSCKTDDRKHFYDSLGNIHVRNGKPTFLVEIE